MRCFNRFTRLLAVALLLSLLACSKSSTKSDDSAIVKLEGNQNVTPFYQNELVNQIFIIGQVKNSGEATAYNVTVNYTLGSLSGSTTTSPATIEPDETADFAKLINTNSLPQSAPKFEITWEDEPTTPVIYTISDLEGNWLGAFQFKFPDGRTRTENNIGIRLDAQGNVTMDIPNLVSISGKLNVSASGELSGSYSFVNIIDVSKDIRDTSTIEVQENMITKDEITLTQNVTYTRSDGTGGTYTAFGGLLRQ